MGSETETREFLSGLERSLLPLEQPIHHTEIMFKQISNRTVIKGLYEFSRSTLIIKGEINHNIKTNVSSTIIEVDFRSMRTHYDQNAQIGKIMDITTQLISKF